jgi:hypothetical protein
VKIQPYSWGKYTFVEGLLRLFFLLKQFKYKITIEFQQKNKATYRGVFVVSIWFYCKYHVGFRVIGYLYVYKLLFIFKNG